MAEQNNTEKHGEDEQPNPQQQPNIVIPSNKLNLHPILSLIFIALAEIAILLWQLYEKLLPKFPITANVILFSSMFCIGGYGVYNVTKSEIFQQNYSKYIAKVWICYFVFCVFLGVIFICANAPENQSPEPLKPTQTGWMPPELPPGCSNVFVYFGNIAVGYSLEGVKMSQPGGDEIPIKDLSPNATTGMEKMPGYSRRQRDLWIRLELTANIGGQTVYFPVTPYLESNRLYVAVQLPFSNQKEKLVMDDDFDSELKTLPPLWDRNYNTNLCFYEVVNELTNPVLQIAYGAPNEVRIFGIFQESGNSVYESFGPPPVLYTFFAKPATNIINVTNNTITTRSLDSTHFEETITFCATDSPAEIGEIFTNELYRATYPYQRAFFKYPSCDWPGVFADWVTVMRTTLGTMIVDPTNRSQLLPLPETFGTKLALAIAYGTICAGILWMCFGWIIYQRPFNIKSP